MDERLSTILEGTFALRENEGRDKVVSLEDAIRLNVKTSMALHIGENASAIIAEILRQFHRKTPQFSLITHFVSGYTTELVYNGLVRQLITSSCSELYPTPGPSRAVQKAYKEGSIDIENWSLLTLTQRLMAGALGVPFMPTRSLGGSTMAEDNRESLREIEDPFGVGKARVVKALNPDLSLIHGWAADRYGNTIMVPPSSSGQGAWGALASKGGVVVTVEKLVSTDFIREYSTFVSIPGYMVNSVSVAPLGSHPFGVFNPGIKEFEGYGADYGFMVDYRKARQNDQDLDAFLKKWVLDCRNHQDYLDKLGTEKISYLKERADRDLWKKELESLSEELSTTEPYNPTEMMVIAGARKVRERAEKAGCRVINAGMGAAALSGWLASYQLRDSGYKVELLMGAGWYGHTPRPADPWLLSYPNMMTCKMIGDTVDAYGVWTGADNKCLSTLGAAQIDKYGNLNSTKTDANYIIGSGGANDAANAREVVVVLPQSPSRFLDTLPYITCNGENVRAVVSNKGIFERSAGEELVLTGYFPNPKLSNLEEIIEDIKKGCGWNLKVSPKLEEIAPPGFEELMTLRLLDPKGLFIKA
ncbi:CoA-transferase [Chloroflexota bacterium]